MRSYHSVNSRTVNVLVKKSNTLADVFERTYLGNTAPSSGGGDLSSYALKTDVDSSFNNVHTKVYVDTSLNNLRSLIGTGGAAQDPSINLIVIKNVAQDISINNVYTKTYVDSSIYTKTYVDGSLNANYYVKNYVDDSLNDIRNNYTTLTLKNALDISINDITSNYATTSFVNSQFNNLINSAPDTLNTLNEIAIAIQSDVSLVTQAFSRLDKLDSSINTLYSINTINDTTLTITAGNISIGTGSGTNTINIGTGNTISILNSATPSLTINRPITIGYIPVFTSNQIGYQIVN